MSVRRNLARARSHLIFIAALLSASGYILWVEGAREQPQEVSAVAEPRARSVEPNPAQAIAPATWRVQFGAFRTAEAAGRQWDVIRGNVKGSATALEVVLVASEEAVRLQAGPFASVAQAERFCGVVRAKKIACVASRSISGIPLDQRQRFVSTSRLTPASDR